MKARLVSKGNAKPTLNRLQRLGKGKKGVKVGLPKSKADQSNINKLAWNEFGTEHIPERPAVRNTVSKNKGKYRRQLKSAARQIIHGKASFNGVLEKIGIQAVGDIQDGITSLSTPPNAPSTIRQKGSSNPLIDSGAMRAAITHKVEV